MRNQIGPFDQLHRDAAAPVGLEQLPQLHDIGMMEPLNGAKLALELRQRDRTEPLELLERNALTGASISRFVDGAEAAVPEQPDQLVLADNVASPRDHAAGLMFAFGPRQRTRALGSHGSARVQSFGSRRPRTR